MSPGEMIRGLVRAAEMIEQRDGGKVWDSEVSAALEEARKCGWGKNKSGLLQLELPDPAKSRG